jgi:hypothetical protein
MSGMFGAARGFLRRVRRETRGAAAAELAIWLLGIGFPLLNAVDVGFYVYKGTQVETAAQAAVDEAWHLCSTSSLLPATTKCTSLSSNMTTAAQGQTGLGTAVTLNTASEGYYCSSTNALVLRGAVSGSQPTCSDGVTKAGDYLFVTASYTYTPMFGHASVVSFLANPITRQAWVRLL